MFYSGFAGVDMFFVVSGYLVGGNILQSVNDGSFTFSDFFYRRAKRILPALYVMILTSFIIGYFTMMPKTYQYFGGAAAASLFAISNFWFFDQINYFNPAASIDPLVHTWSLGVEEQFYLIAPISLMLIGKIKQSYLSPFITIIFLISIFFSIFLGETFPEASFYLLHTRMWELTLGMLVFIMRDQEKYLTSIDPSFKNFITFFGLSLVFIGVWWIPVGVAWPSYWALVPTMGVSLILFACPRDSFIYRMLSIRPVRFVGVISYSLYLWHQPVISFLKITNRYPHDLSQKIQTIFIIVILATLSWAIIERPLREQKFGISTNKVFILFGFIIIFGIAIGGHVTKGYPARLPQDVYDVWKLSSFKGEANRRCLKSRDEVADLDWNKICLFSGYPSPQNVIWGDSHSAAISDVLGEELLKRDEGLEIVTLSSCLPIPNLINHNQNRPNRCSEFNEKAIEYIINNKNLKNVFMFATWDNYFMHGGHPNMYGFVSRDEFFAYPIYGSPNMDEDQRVNDITTELKNVLERLLQSGKNVYIINSVPRPNASIPEIYAQELWRGVPIPLAAGYPRKYFDQQRYVTNVIFNEIQQYFVDMLGNTLHVLDPTKTFCDEEQCYIVKYDKILYSDGNHLSMDGARLLLKTLPTRF